MIRELNPREYLYKFGSYTRERRIKIKSIPTVIVDPHNEVVSSWMEIEGQALLIRIDDHPDMNDKALTFDQAQKEISWKKIKTYADYAKHSLYCTNFNAFAVNKRKVGSIYWYNPREDFVKAYGRVKNGVFVGQPKTIIDTQERIVWVPPLGPKSKDISLKQFIKDILQFNGPIILDIDLDGFLSTGDPIWRWEESSDMLERLHKTKKLIESISKRPIAISIARSLSPIAYTPRNRVDEIQDLTLKMLDEVF